jgi:regulation of enolase protein 1 (concanavalin A-like superfamily)
VGTSHSPRPWVRGVNAESGEVARAVVHVVRDDREECVVGEEITIDVLPVGLRWLRAPERWEVGGPDALAITAGARTDLFADPDGTAVHTNAPALVGDLPGDANGDYRLSAKVTPEFASTYDAGVLLLWSGERAWAKLCFERSPQGQPMIVSVVNRGVSDDANGFTVAGASVWLRVARVGPAYAFHASTDGATWQLVRYFALGHGPHQLAAGFLAQSPTGDGSTTSFEQVTYTPERLGDLRDGT